MQSECSRTDDEVNTRKGVEKPPQRADDEVNTQKLVNKSVKTRKWLSFPLLVAGLRAKDEIATSQFEDFLLIEWSPIIKSVIFHDFSKMLRRARLRKQSVAATFLKKIFIGCTDWPETGDLVLIGPDLKEQFEKLLHSREFTSLGLVFAGVWSDQADLQLLATQKFRQLFRDLRCPLSMPLIIRFGVIPQFDEFLGKENSPILQGEAALALIDITSEKVYSIKFLMNHELVGILIKVLDFPDSHVRDQAVLVLGRIAERPEGCDLVLRHEAERPLLEKVLYPLLQEVLLPLSHDMKKLVSYKDIDKHLPTLRIATYTLLRFWKGASRPGVHEMEVSAALPVLVLLVHLSDEVVLKNACSALACLTDSTYRKTQVVINNDTWQRLVQLLTHESPSVVTPAVRTLGNIVARDDIQSQCIVDFGALPCLWKLLSKNIEKVEVWRTIANITKGNHIQIEEEQKLEVKEKLDKSVMGNLWVLCVELDIPYTIATPRKEDIVAKLMNFLDPPHAMTSDDEKEESSKGKKRRRENAEQMSQEDIVAKLDFLDAPHASQLLDEMEESREGKKRRRESAEQMSHQGESQEELSSEDKLTPSADEIWCAFGEILKEVDITKNMLMAIETADWIRQLQVGNQVLNEQINKLTSAGEEWHRSVKALEAKNASLETEYEKKVKDHALRESKLESQVRASNDQLSHQETEVARKCANMASDIEHKECELAKLAEVNRNLHQSNEALNDEVASLNARIYVLRGEVLNERRLVAKEFEKRRDLVLAESRRDMLKEMSERKVNIAAELADAIETVKLVREELGTSSSSDEESD